MMDTKIEGSLELLRKEKYMTNEEGIEVKDKKFRSVQRSIISKNLLATSLLSAYYFNFRLNFYEPFIEQFELLLGYKAGKFSSKPSF
jgi:hypothetical protein